MHSLGKTVLAFALLHSVLQFIVKMITRLNSATIVSNWGCRLDQAVESHCQPRAVFRVKVPQSPYLCSCAQSPRVSRLVTSQAVILHVPVSSTRLLGRYLSRMHGQKEMELQGHGISWMTSQHTPPPTPQLLSLVFLGTYMKKYRKGLMAIVPLPLTISVPLECLSFLFRHYLPRKKCIHQL